MAMPVQSKWNEIYRNGKWVILPAFKIQDHTIFISGRFLKVAAIKNEFYENEEISDPTVIINQLKDLAPKADIFTFSQKIPNNEPKFKYYYELDNVAAIPISTYEDWWQNGLDRDRRRMIRRGYKRGVEVKLCQLDDHLVRGIMGIYNEVPFRQGRRFWSFGKDFETVKKDTATDINRSDFICAYHQGELIGFIKIIYGNNCGNLNLILANMKDRDKNPIELLVSKAVEVCAQKKLSYLTYGKFIYGKKGEDSLSFFKRKLHFIKMEVPQYYVPLTLKGEIAIWSGFHHFPNNLIPERVLKTFIKLRSERNKDKNSLS